MSRRLAVVALIVGILTVPVAATAVPASPFTGSWTSVDIVDGSSQRLAIGGGLTPHLLLYDDGATACGVDGGVPLYAARVTGIADISDAMLVADLDIYCLASPSYFWGTAEGGVFNYNAADDTLMDFTGTVWHRAGS